MAKRPGVGDPAPDVHLVNKNGRTVRLSARWRRKPLVAVFLRHFG
jgi:peroxiredoxin